MLGKYIDYELSVYQISLMLGCTRTSAEIVPLRAPRLSDSPDEREWQAMRIRSIEDLVILGFLRDATEEFSDEIAGAVEMQQDAAGLRIFRPTGAAHMMFGNTGAPLEQQLLS